MKILVCILLRFGYHKLIQQRMFWSLDDDLGIELISKFMAHNRFLEIKRLSTDFSDNDRLIKNVKIFKVRPLNKNI